jgi:hypothetical protein
MPHPKKPNGKADPDDKVGLFKGRNQKNGVEVLFADSSFQFFPSKRWIFPEHDIIQKGVSPKNLDGSKKQGAYHRKQ